jgi:DNA-binding beta-propeller fold protein YncE
MAEKFQCPSCGGGIDFDGRDAATMRCPYCNTSIVIPEALRPKVKKAPDPEPSVIDVTRGGGRQPTIITMSGGAPTTIDLRGTQAGNVAKTAVGCGVFGILLSVLLPVIMIVVVGAIVWYTFSATMPGVSGGANPFADLGIDMPEISGIPNIAPGFATVTTAFGAEGTGAGSFQQAWSGGVDGEGRIYVSDYESHRIQVFDSEGEFITQWQPDGEYISSVAVARDGTVYAVYGGKIHKFNGDDGSDLGVVVAAGTAIGSGAPLLDDVYFEEVAVTPDGGLLAVGRGTIYRFNSQSEITLTIPDAIEAITDNSQSTLHVAEDGIGNIYVASQTENSIFKFNSEGRYQQRFGSEGDGEGQFLGFIDGLAVDSKGRIYTADFHGIQVFDSTNGQWIAQINDAEPDATSVYDISVTPANELLVVTTHRVFKFALPE